MIKAKYLFLIMVLNVFSFNGFALVIQKNQDIKYLGLFHYGFRLIAKKKKKKKAGKSWEGSNLYKTGSLG